MRVRARARARVMVRAKGEGEGEGLVIADHLHRMRLAVLVGLPVWHGCVRLAARRRRVCMGAPA